MQEGPKNLLEKEAGTPPSETLVKNNEAKLDPEKEINSYLKRSDPEYLKRLAFLSTEIGIPMNPETRIVACIPVAGHQEAANIYKTLESYSRQDVNMEQLEVLLYVNSSEKVREEKKVDIEKTIAEIKRAQKDFPKLPIRFVQEFLPQKEVNISNIRRILTDLAVCRQAAAGIKRDVILLSNDADNQGMSEKYVSSYIKYFENHPEKEGAVGNLQFDPNTFIRLPVIHLKQELVTLLDQTGFRNGNVMLFGNNSCMTSSIYAAIGGYRPDMKVAEQEWTGNTIRKLRKSKNTLGFVSEGPLVTSSRRAAISTILNRKQAIEFGDVENEAKMRNLDINSLPIFDYANRQALAKLREELNTELNWIIDEYEKGEKLGKDAYFYRSNLEKVGMTYTVDESGVAHITNMDKFIERQEKMQGLIKGGETNMAKVIEAVTENTKPEESKKLPQKEDNKASWLPGREKSVTPDGTVEFRDAKGILRSRHLTDGTTEIYNEKGVLHSKTFVDKSYEVYKPDGEILLYNAQGKLDRRIPPFSERETNAPGNSESDQIEALAQDKARNPFKYFLIENLDDEGVACLFKKEREEITLDDIDEMFGKDASGETVNFFLESAKIDKLDEFNTIYVSSNGLSLHLQNPEEISHEGDLFLESPLAIYELVHPKIEETWKGLTYTKGKELLEKEAIKYQAKLIKSFRGEKDTDSPVSKIQALKSKLMEKFRRSK